MVQKLGLVSTSQTQLTSDPQGTDYTATTYDSLGRVANVYNPTRCNPPTTNCGGEPTWGKITYGYDALSRPTSVTDQDNNVVNASYTNNVATVTDETGKKRSLQSDGLGRMSQVTEDPGGLGYVTAYGYDPLGNLTSVVQNGSRNRSYAYDFLSRLTSSTTPEAGTFCYGTVSGGSCQKNGYDANGNLATTTDARGIVTTYTHDALHRVTQKSYSDGTVPALFGYDQTSVTVGTDTFSIANSKGRLSWSWSGTSSQPIVMKAYSYDSMSRVAFMKEGTPVSGNSDYQLSFAYDLAGNPTSITYPSGRVVTQQYTAANGLNLVNFASFAGTSVGYNYLTGASYAPNGAPTSISVGDGLTETLTYNSRLQPSNEQVSSSILTAFYRSLSFYDASSHNNGSLMTITDNLNAGRTQNFTYDSLNRLSTAKTTVTSGADCWAQQFGYDAWGNLLTATPTQSGCSMTALSQAVNTKNQITNTGFSYDLSGNTLADGLNSYVYDAESRVKSLNSGAASYNYAADGERAVKTVGTDTTEYIGAGGATLAERKGNGDWTDYIYANGRLLARADTYEDRIHTYGTRAAGDAFTGAEFEMANSGGLAGYVLQSGDKFYWRQYQGSGAVGGVAMWFSDGSYYTGSVDQDGQPANADTTDLSWHYRRVDLTAFAGKTIDHWTFDTNTATAAGSWDIYYQDFALVSTDGTVRPLYNRQKTISLTVNVYNSNMTGVGYEVNHVSGDGFVWLTTTTYYHGDHLSSSRIITTVSGYPTWSGTFLPFGQEWNPQITVNNYKFTGDERDAESQLDHTQFRQYSSSLGRWSTPDPADFAATKPINPQSWNRYAYVTNDPVDYFDPFGLDPPKQSGVACRNPQAHCPNQPPGVSDNYNFAYGDMQFELMWIGAESQDELVGWKPVGVIDNSLISLGGCGDDPNCVINELAVYDTVWSFPSIGVQLTLVVTPEESNRTGGSVLDNRANALASALNKTGVQSLGNPCTLALWYGASAGGAVVVSSTQAGGALFPATKDAIDAFKVWYSLADPEVQKVVKFAASGAAIAIAKAGQGCGSLQ